MAPNAPPATRKRKQRVTAACEFCRKRKLGCDNAAPKCCHCVAHGKECEYAQRVKKPRPSNSRIRDLEQENARLRRSVMASAEADADRQLRAEVESNIGIRTPSSRATTGSSSSPSTSPAQTSALTQHGSLPVPDDASGFHGPTSAMFEQKSGGHRPSLRSSDTERSLLLAEAARQRQLEMINLHSGKLDLDGVDPEQAMDLLSIFWNRQHCSGTFVYRPAFMRDMACGGKYFSRLLLNAILFVASKNIQGTLDMTSTCKGEVLCSQGTYFRRRFEALLHESNSKALLKSDITTVQALLLVSDALFSWCDEKSLSWHYAGIAINMIVDLGIHVEGSRSIGIRSASTEGVEIQRRVFWAAFVLDKLLAVYQGRPARLRSEEISVPIVFYDEYEELEPLHTLNYSPEPRQLGSPAYSVSTFTQLCKLSTILDGILKNLYSETSGSRKATDLSQGASTLYSDLEKWRESLPKHLTLANNTTPLPHILNIHSMFHAFKILLYRPFVSDGHLQSASPSAASEAFKICISAANETCSILKHYNAHYCVKTAPYFMSYATYVSATIHLRMAAQKGPGSVAHGHLRNCLDTLSEQKRVCRAPKRAFGVLFELMKRLNVFVDGYLPGGQRDPGAAAPTGASESDNLPEPASTFGGSDMDSLAILDFDIDAVLQTFNQQPNQPMQMDYSKPGMPVDAYGANNASFPSDYMSEYPGDQIPLLPFDQLFGYDLLESWPDDAWPDPNTS